MKPRSKLVLDFLLAGVGWFLPFLGALASGASAIFQYWREKNPTFWKHVQAWWKYKGSWSGFFCGESQTFNSSLSTGGLSGFPVDPDTRAVKGRIPGTNIVFWGNVLSDGTAIVGSWENKKTGREGLFMAD